MSEQKDKCPECGGEGHRTRIHSRPKYLEVTCPTCNGTGEKKLDRPDRKELPQGVEYQTDSAELRDWMREHSWCYLGGTQVIDKSRTWHYMSPKGTKWELVENWEGKIISIIALFPDIEEAKTQERERIKIELSGFVEMLRHAPEMHGDIQSDPLKTQEFLIWWQALKGEK